MSVSNQQTGTVSRRILAGKTSVFTSRPPTLLGIILALFLSACGGSSTGSGSADGTSLSFNALWEQGEPGGGAALTADGSGSGFGSTLPEAVQTLPVVFTPATGATCCVAVDPRAVPIDPITGQRLLVLEDLPPGAANVTLTGFPSSVAPAPDGVAARCATDPASVGRACDNPGPATPSFESAPQPVSIVPASETDAGDIELESVPFLLDVDPPADSETTSPVGLRFVVADAVHPVEADSIAASFSQGGLDSGALPIELTACDDFGSTPCSANGALQVRGFRARTVEQELSPGLANARIAARNEAVPPRQLDYDHSFRVLAPTATQTATASPTSTPTVTPTRTPTATRTSTFTPSFTITPSSTPTPSLTQTPSATATPTYTSTTTATPTLTLTPTSTATATHTASPTSTATPSATTSPTPSPTATAQPAVPIDGTYDGLTEQGRPLRFVIENGAVTSLFVDYRVEGEICFIDSSTAVRVVPPAVVEDRRFTATVSRSLASSIVAITLQGVIDNNGTASGTVSLVYTQSTPLRPCVVAALYTWTAEQVSAE